MNASFMRKKISKNNSHFFLHQFIKSLANCFWNNRNLIFQMTKREVIARYKGSSIGLAWAFLNPVLMLTVYTVVFSVIFNARWGMGDESSKVHFAVVLFTGLICLNFFNEILNKSSTLIVSNVNYVKKVIFPLEVLPIIVMLVSLFHTFISLIILFCFLFIFDIHFYLTLIFIPIIFFPLIMMAVGTSYFIASMGVYIRDISQIIGIVTLLLMFLSPIFYPISAVPDAIQKFIMINPLTFIIEELRKVIFLGITPDVLGFFIYFFISLVILFFGYIFFQKTKKGFADVL
jgi:lipopolysaccharide transport system permease protein